MLYIINLLLGIQQNTSSSKNGTFYNIEYCSSLKSTLPDAMINLSNSQSQTISQVFNWLLPQ